MGKPHPNHKLLIEREVGLTWRVVARKTTATGLDREFHMIGNNYRNLRMARWVHDEVKNIQPRPV